MQATCRRALKSRMDAKAFGLMAALLVLAGAVLLWISSENLDGPQGHRPGSQAVGQSNTDG